MSKRKEQRRMLEQLQKNGIETHATVTAAGEASDGGTRKLKGAAEIKFTDENGREHTAYFRTETAGSYFKGEDVVIRYAEYDGGIIALPADSEEFVEEDSVKQGWNRFLWRTVVQVLKAVLKFYR